MKRVRVWQPVQTERSEKGSDGNDWLNKQGMATTKKTAAEWNAQQHETTQRHHHPCWEIRIPWNRGKGKQLNAMGVKRSTVNMKNRREGTPEKGIVLFQCRRVQLVIQKKGRHAQLLQESQRLAHLHHCSRLSILNVFFLLRT